MNDLMDSLNRIELGVCDVACVYHALNVIQDSMAQLAHIPETGPYADSLRIVSCFLESILSSLDVATTAARGAIKSVQ